MVPRPCQKAPSTADSVVSYDESTSLSTDELSGSSYRPSGEASSGGSSSGLGAFKKTSIRELHLKRVKADPMYYIGIKPEYYYLVDQLAKSTQSDEISVLICLQKIRLNETFKGLGYDYGVSESFCSKIFCKNVPLLCECLSTLILWPNKEIIRRRLPIYFSARYFNVQSMIDCFEIEKPGTKPYHGLTIKKQIP